MISEGKDTQGPVIIEAFVDPYELPYPAEINLEQAEKMAEALAKGTPYRGKIMMAILSDKVRELLQSRDLLLLFRQPLEFRREIDVQTQDRGVFLNEPFGGCYVFNRSRNQDPRQETFLPNPKIQPS